MKVLRGALYLESKTQLNYWVCTVHGGNCCQHISGLCCKNQN
jgi:hypothetical protein